MEKDCQTQQLNREDAMDRHMWRKLITDIACECSSAMGSPGLSGIQGL